MNVEDACDCWLCAGEDLAEKDDYDRNLAWHVQDHGWSVVAIAEEHELPGWTYSVGMWHTMRSPEVCMFGLRLPDMHAWVNTTGAQIRAGAPLAANSPLDGVLAGFPLMVRPVDYSWYPDLFGLALNFYRRPPLPIMQLIWPDRHGVFPWEPGAGERCRTHQPRLWLPKDDHPPSLWTRLNELMDSPFPGVAIDELVPASRCVIEGEAPIAGIVHTHQGQWRFLSAAPDELGFVHLRHLVSDHPHIRDFADMPRGYEAWEEPDGNWSRTSLE